MSIGPPVVLGSQGLDVREAFRDGPGAPVGDVVVGITEATAGHDSLDHLARLLPPSALIR